MKQLVSGLSILFILVILLAYNSFGLENTIRDIQSEIINSYTMSIEESRKVLINEFEKWEASALYINSVLSEYQCNKITDSFFECFSEPGNLIFRNKLVFELESIISSEKLSFQTIL